MIVSSAKIKGAEVLLIVLGASFIYRRKSRGPKTVPYRTPCLTFAQIGTLLLLPVSLHTAILKYLLSR